MMLKDKMAALIRWVKVIIIIGVNPGGLGL